MTTITGPDLCYNLAARKKARYLSRLYDSKLAPAGLSVSQFSILSLLETHGPLKVLELAQMLIMERSSLVRAMKPLQAVGYLITELPKSGRSFNVSLSPLGFDKVKEAAPLWQSAQAEFENEVGRGCAVRQRDDVLKLNLKA